MTSLVTVYEPQFTVTVNEITQDVTVNELVTNVQVTSDTVVAAQGPKGDKGDPGAASTVPGPAGPQNLFVQPTQPVYSGQAVWFRTGMPGGGVDILIQSGV